MLFNKTELTYNNLKNSQKESSEKQHLVSKQVKSSLNVSLNHQQQKLAEDNFRLAAHIAKKFDNTPYEYDDLVQIGCIGLLKAAASFDPNKNIKFSTYAGKCISNEIKMFIRKENKKPNLTSLDDCINKSHEDNKRTLHESVRSNFDCEDIILEKFQMQEIADTIEQTLNSKEKTILTKRFINKEFQRNVAKEFNISKSYLSRIEKRIKDKVKKALDDQVRPTTLSKRTKVK